MSDYPNSLDVSRYNDAETAAKEVGNYLEDYAQTVLDQSPSEVTVRKADTGWEVMWEGGPFNWAVSVTGGESIGGAEFPEHRGKSEIEGMFNHSSLSFECRNSYTIQIFDN